MNTIMLTLGFTDPYGINPGTPNDLRERSDYVSFSDGYRLGAQQVSVTLVIQTGATDVLPTTGVVEATFAASNYENAFGTDYGLTPATSDREIAFNRLVVAIQHAIREQTRGGLRSLSVGDTVTVTQYVPRAGDPANLVVARTFACESLGWTEVWPEHARLVVPSTKE